jgi:cell wall-associated NlpC family hydrolase
MSALFRVQRLLVLPILLAAALVATTWISAPQADGAHSKREKKIRIATHIALRQRGDAYAYGAEGPNRFDCSGLTYYSYKKVGIYLPRSSDAQYRYVRHIPKKHIKKGDFVFFHDGGGVYHVGIFVDWRDGRRVIVHAPQPGQRVHKSQIWTGSWWAGTLRPRP